MPNRLAKETSPYLLQHQHNPVDWHAWGAEAFALAAQQQKPIFLSVGYSACHWCHVMEHESFENHEIARTLNEHFVSIKVDREERPDVDQVYMQAVQMLTGRGGWPMSVFLTPQGQPFFGGTYWPPTARSGMPGFDQVLRAISEAWRDKQAEVVAQAENLTQHLRQASAVRGGSGRLSADLLEAAARNLHQIYDPTHGGFGGAPKFPHPIDLRMLARLWRRDRQGHLLDMLTVSLERMAAGGIYDQLGGGFHRYAVDERWLVPHFEKMLYDNALLASAYLDGYRATEREDFARIARETLDYVLREMTSPEGGFYSAQDADSEGVEGKFYVWTPSEIAAVLGAARADTFCKVYDVSESGNFEHANILHLSLPLATRATQLGRELPDLERELAQSRQELLAARSKRVWPGLDDKVLVAWNALVIEALADAAGALDEPRYLAAAQRAADFLLAKLRPEPGRLLHSYRAGQARFEAYLDDYACLGNALISLYEATFDERYVDAAVELVEAMLERFADADDGGFYFTAHDHETLVARARDVQDGATPSGNAMAATVLLRLSRLTGESRYAEAGERTLAAFATLMERASLATAQMLIALDILLSPARQALLLGDPKSAEMQGVLRDLRRRLLPPIALACRDLSSRAPRSTHLDAMFAGKTNQGAGPTLYLCENFACFQPETGATAIHAALAALAESGGS